MATPFRLRHADRIAGLFLLSALVVIVVVAFLVVSRQSLFARRVPYWTVFDDGEGLKAEAPVRIVGIEVGKIRQVRLTDDDRVRVDFEVLTEYTDRLVADPPGVDCEVFTRPASCGARVHSPAGLGLGTIFPGGAGLVIVVGSREGTRVEPGGFVPSERQEGLMARLEREGLLDQARAIVAEVAGLLTKLNDPAGPLMQSLRNLEQVTTQAQSGQGVLGELMRPRSPLHLKVEASLDSLQKSMAKVEASTTSIEAVTGGVQQKMDKVQSMIDELESFSRDAAEAGRRLKNFAAESEKVPPATREAIDNLNRRIDDLGVILKGIKKSVPFGMADDKPEPVKKNQP